MQGATLWILVLFDRKFALGSATKQKSISCFDFVEKDIERICFL